MSNSSAWPSLSKPFFSASSASNRARDVRAVEGDDVVGLLGLGTCTLPCPQKHDDYKENKWCEYHCSKQFNTPSSSFTKESKEEDGFAFVVKNDGKELMLFL